MSIRIHLTDGQREVTIKLDGCDAANLKQAERAARRLFASIAGAPQPARPTFGFTLDGTTLSADTERAPDEQYEDDEDE